jgi:serine/threonine protein kinase
MSSPESPPRTVPPVSMEVKADERYRAGDLIEGKYRLTRPLGEGGMGVVWVAKNVPLDLDVAVKLIALRGGSNRSVLAGRLLQEARTAARVTHPAICRTFDFGETHLGDPFVVSELLHGETLAEVLERQLRLPAVLAVQTLLPIADGLALAHAHGIVHRDVKPENLFLARDLAGRIQPKLLDFGIARRVDGDAPGNADSGLQGTPTYMSPEQVRGRPADFRADVWSLCVVLYQSITGRVPFSGEHHDQILGRVLTEDPLPTTAAAAGDEALWRVLKLGLRKRPEERWNSVRELGEALARWLLDHGVREDLSGASLRTTWLEAADGGSSEPLSERSARDEANALGSPVSSHPSRPSGVATSLRYLEDSWSESVERRWSEDTFPGKVDVPTLPAPSAPARPDHKRLIGIVMVALLLGMGLGMLLARPAAPRPSLAPGVPSAGAVRRP